jgi:hypothetical protein
MTVGTQVVIVWTERTGQLGEPGQTVAGEVVATPAEVEVTD